MIQTQRVPLPAIVTYGVIVQIIIQFLLDLKTTDQVMTSSIETVITTINHKTNITTYATTNTILNHINKILQMTLLNPPLLTLKIPKKLPPLIKIPPANQHSTK